MDLIELEARGNLYCKQREGAILGKRLGDGTDGAVWELHEPGEHVSAIKVLQDIKQFVCERDCYRRLRDCEVTEICGFAVPRLINYDNALRIVSNRHCTPSVHSGLR